MLKIILSPVQSKQLYVQCINLYLENTKKNKFYQDTLSYYKSMEIKYLNIIMFLTRKCTKFTNFSIDGTPSSYLCIGVADYCKQNCSFSIRFL